MFRLNIRSTHIAATLFAIPLTVALLCMNGVATSAPPSIGKPAESAAAGPADADATARTVKELQRQVAELQARMNDLQKPRIVAAGVATFQLGEEQDNATNVRVKLSADVAARIGDDYLVLLTNRYPTGGYPFFSPYWKKAKDGFDITLIDVTLGPNATSSYTSNKNRTFLIDWIVVKK